MTYIRKYDYPEANARGLLSGLTCQSPSFSGDGRTCWQVVIFLTSLIEHPAVSEEVSRDRDPGDRVGAKGWG